MPVAPFLGLATLTLPPGVLGSCRPLPRWVASGEGRCRARSPWACPSPLALLPADATPEFSAVLCGFQTHFEGELLTNVVGCEAEFFPETDPMALVHEAVQVSGPRAQDTVGRPHSPFRTQTWRKRAFRVFLASPWSGLDSSCAHPVLVFCGLLCACPAAWRAHRRDEL